MEMKAENMPSLNYFREHFTVTNSLKESEIIDLDGEFEKLY